MVEKRGTKGLPIRLGDEHGEDESTLLDVPMDAVREALRAGDGDEGSAWDDAAAASSAPPRRAPPPSVADDDPEKTEMIERPDLGEVAPARTQRGVVPLGSDAARLVGKTGRVEREPPKTDTFTAVMSDEAETVMMTRPTDDRQVRALDELSLPSIGVDLSDDKTLSRPKIARMTFRPEDLPKSGEPDEVLADTMKRHGDGGDAPARPPAPRPLPAPQGRPRPSAAVTSAAAAPDADGAAAVGTLVVEAPPGAAVFIDGSERGSGRVEVRDLDRFARVAVRVHHAGYRPWARTLSLDGRDELRITPELEPR